MIPMQHATRAEQPGDNVVELSAWRRSRRSLSSMAGDTTRSYDDDPDDDPAPIAS